MRLHEGLPGGASGNCDVVTGKQYPHGDGQWLSLGIEEEQVPPGLLCIHENTVKMMVDLLGWKLSSVEYRAEHKKLKADLSDALRRITELEDVLDRVRDVSGRSGVMA